MLKQVANRVWTSSTKSTFCTKNSSLIVIWNSPLVFAKPERSSGWHNLIAVLIQHLPWSVPCRNRSPSNWSHYTHTYIYVVHADITANKLLSHKVKDWTLLPQNREFYSNHIKMKNFINTGRKREMMLPVRRKSIWSTNKSMQLGERSLHMQIEVYYPFLCS